jgi:hypothetical protein
MDVHKKESQICILTDAGELIERRVHTEPPRFAAVLGDRPRARIRSCSKPRRTANGWRAAWRRCLASYRGENLPTDDESLADQKDK